MFKKILLFFMAILVAFQPLVSAASDLNGAFSNLLGPGGAVSVNKPGNYQSGARNSFVAGGLEMRIPRASSAPQLFSVTAPRVSAGCNGISATFGGFSFISGAEFESMLKSIASGAALGFVSMMVMKVMCPPCEAVVQFLKNAAQAAARLSIDSCKWGQDLANQFQKGDISIGDPVSICGSSTTASGASTDWLASMSSVCKSVQGAVDTIKDMNKDAASTPEGLSALKCEMGGVGNTTWSRLTAFDYEGGTSAPKDSDAYKRKLLLLNLLGSTMNAEGTNDKVGCELVPGEGPVYVEPGSTKGQLCTPKLSPQDAVGLFMCGSPSTLVSSSQRVKEYCSTFFENASSSAAAGGSYSSMALKENVYYTCSSGNAADDAANCPVMVLTDSSAIVTGQGFLVHINDLLHKGVKAIVDNTAMPDDVIRLVQVAPFPLYQAINAAAVYPAAADDLLDSMSILVAEQAAVSFMDDTLRLQGRKGGGKLGCMSEKQASVILDTVSAMRAGNKARTQQMAQNITIQEALSEQIRQINLSIQKQVMSADMLSSGHYAESVGKALGPNISKGSDTGTATPAN